MEFLWCFLCKINHQSFEKQLFEWFIWNWYDLLIIEKVDVIVKLWTTEMEHDVPIVICSFGNAQLADFS